MRGHHGIRGTAAGLLTIGLTTLGCTEATQDDVDAGWTPAPAIESALGPLRGVEDGDVLRYRGIPYAEPPVGERRLAPAEPVTAWTQQRDATTSGPPCLQTGGAGVVGDEDCLFLDVTVPNSATEEPRPVMVWFHGGSFTEGAAADYDPRRLAVQGDVVVVTVGYRLGALAQLAPAGVLEGGQFALGDQQEALRVVRSTAEAFGGDPDNVTIFGESAGGSAVCHQLVSPQAQGLFRRAVVQSAIECGATAPDHAYGLPNPTLGSTLTPSLHLPDVQARSTEAAARLGCPADEDEARLACLRALPAEAFLSLGPEFNRYAVGDGLVPHAPVDALGEVEVPVLAGYTRDESRFYPLLAALLGAPYPSGSFEPAIREAFGDRAEEVLQRYPRTEFADDAEAWSAVYTDATWACPQLHANDLMSAGGAQVWAYEFADRTAAPPLPAVPGAPDPGAAHSSELPYLFDVASQPLDLSGQKVPLDPDQSDLAAEMIGVWADFARTGTVRAPSWSEDRQALTFSTTGTTLTVPARTHRCDLWID